MITKEEVQKIGILARIELSEADVDKLQQEMSTILSYVDDLKQVNTDSLQEVNTVTGLENVFRSDVAENCDFKDQLLALAPETKERYIKVKSIF